MHSIPRPTSSGGLEWIARQLIEMEAEISGAGGLRGEAQSLRASVRALVEAVERLDANITALNEEMRAFLEEERQHKRG